LTATLTGGSKPVRKLAQTVSAGLLNFPKALQIIVDINLRSPAGKRTHLLRSES
jgi:hypothetical protein